MKITLRGLIRYISFHFVSDSCFENEHSNLGKLLSIKLSTGMRMRMVSERKDSENLEK